MSGKEKPMTAYDVEQLLLARYPADKGYEMFFEVHDKTGMGGMNRRADAIMMGSWTSTGRWLTGFEIKVHRSDWLNELKQPEKASEIMRFCRHWYLVAAPGVVDWEKDVIPAPWGVLEVRGNGLVEKKKPETLAEQPVTPAFLASLLRSARKRFDSAELVHISKLDEKIQERALEIASTLNADLKRKLRYYELEEARMKEGYDESRAYYDEVKRTLDLHVPGAGWAGNKFLAILRVLQANNGGDVLETLSRQMKSIRSTLERAERMLGEATAAAGRAEEQRSAEEMKRVQELMKGEE